MKCLREIILTRKMYLKGKSIYLEEGERDYVFFGINIFFSLRDAVTFFVEKHVFKAQSAYRIFLSAHVRNRKKIVHQIY